VEAHDDEEEEQGKVLVNDSGDESPDDHVKKAAALEKGSTAMNEDSSEMLHDC
jgi:hypothetical protein